MYTERVSSRRYSLLGAAFLGCLGCGDTSVLKIEHEGDSPGECSDGADQDRDGDFDCDDADCIGSGECSDTGAGGTGGGTGAGTGGATDSGSADEPPTTPTVSISPSRPRDSETLRCEITTESTDPDGDAVSYSYAWIVDGAVVGTDSALPPDASVAGDSVRCAVTPTANDRSGSPGIAETEIVPDCAVHVDHDFSSDWGPFSNRAGDTTLVSGAARLFRTSTSWAMARTTLPRDEDGALIVRARMALREGTASFSDEAQVVMCLTNGQTDGIEVPGVSQRIGSGYCLALSNETQNGSTAGAMFIENALFDNTASRRLLTDGTTPALNQWVTLEASRDLDHVWTFTVDGREIGTHAETNPLTVRQVTLVGGQDTHAGYGGDLDDAYVEGCP